MKYIQNRTNWCWVAACKVAGEQYKKILWMRGSQLLLRMQTFCTEVWREIFREMIR